MSFLKTYNQLDPNIGQDILNGQYNNKTVQNWPYPMINGKTGTLPCAEFNRGYTGNITATCQNQQLVVDLRGCRVFNGCIYGKTTRLGSSPSPYPVQPGNMSCYSAPTTSTNNSDAMCYFKRAGQYRCFCPPGYYGDGIQTGSGCTKCPTHSSNSGINMNVWRTSQSENEWLQTGPGRRFFPNTYKSSCLCGPGYESRISRWNRTGIGPSPSVLTAYDCLREEQITKELEPRIA